MTKNSRVSGYWDRPTGSKNGTRIDGILYLEKGTRAAPARRPPGERNVVFLPRATHGRLVEGPYPHIKHGSKLTDNPRNFTGATRRLWLEH